MHQALNQVRESLFLDNDARKALKLLDDVLPKTQTPKNYAELAATELRGYAYRLLDRYKDGAKSFALANNLYQAGYCCMLTGNLQQSIQYWQPILLQRQNHWCVSLHGLITGQLNTIPTFLQIRNHVEADVFYLLKARQPHYVKNFTNYADFLAEINYESYKFIGRGLLYAGRLEDAHHFLMKGQKTLPNDAEVYYHLGQYHFKKVNYTEAQVMLKQCLLINPHYIPARDLLDKIDKT